MESSQEERETPLKMTNQESGRLGGVRCKELHGVDFFREIGKRGGNKTKRQMPEDHFVQAGRLGGAATAASHPREHYQELGRKAGKRVRELIALGRATEEALERHSAGEDEETCTEPLRYYALSRGLEPASATD